MKIVFDTRALRTTPEEHGEIELVDGVAHASTPGLATFLAEFGVWDPADPDRRLMPEDGEEYMRAFVVCYRVSYSPATLVEAAA